MDQLYTFLLVFGAGVTSTLLEEVGAVDGGCGPKLEDVATVVGGCAGATSTLLEEVGTVIGGFAVAAVDGGWAGVTSTLLEEVVPMDGA